MPNDREHEELKFLYEVSVKDIGFFKKQQWLVTYYAVLVYGSLITLATLKLVTKSLLCISAVLVAFLCSALLAKLEYSIQVRRGRLEAIRSRFSPSFNEAWSATAKEKEFYIVLLCLLSAAVIGCVVTVLAVLNAT